jgi:hypothetical protein
LVNQKRGPIFLEWLYYQYYIDSNIDSNQILCGWKTAADSKLMLLTALGGKLLVKKGGPIPVYLWYRLEFLLCTLTPEVQCRLVHRNHVIWWPKITKFWRNVNDSKQPYWPCGFKENVKRMNAYGRTSEAKWWQ